MGIPILQAEALALFMESFFYGVFFCLFWIVALVFLQDRNSLALGWAPTSQVRPAVFAVSMTMLLLATAHLGVDVARACRGFMDTSRPGEFFEYVREASFFAKTALWMLQTCLGDAILIWRCFVVYNRSWAYIAPMLAGYLLYIVSACLVIYNYQRSTPDETIFTGGYESVITVHFCATLYVDLLCTAALSWKLFRTTRRKGKAAAGGRSLMPIIVALVNTAALYSVAYTALVIAFVLHSNAQYAILDAIMPITGITFTLIILQIRYHDMRMMRSLSRATLRASTSNESINVPTFRPRSHVRSASLGGTLHASRLRTPAQVTVEVNRLTLTDDDFERMYSDKIERLRSPSPAYIDGMRSPSPSPPASGRMRSPTLAYPAYAV